MKPIALPKTWTPPSRGGTPPKIRFLDDFAQKNWVFLCKNSLPSLVVKRLPKIVKAINSTVNKETGKTAEQIEKAFKDKDEDLLKEVYAKEVANKSKRHKLSKQEYEKGDQARKYEPNEKYKGMNCSAVCNRKGVYTAAGIRCLRIHTEE